MCGSWIFANIKKYFVLMWLNKKNLFLLNTKDQCVESEGPEEDVHFLFEEKTTQVISHMYVKDPGT